jgi:hypothetical protein
MTTPDELHGITDFRSLVAYLRDALDWEIPEDLPLDKLTYSYTADELGLNLDAQVEITQLRPILGQAQPWGVFFVDFDKAELPVGLLKRILSGVSRKKRASANPGDRALFEKNDLLFVSAFGKAEDRRLALAHFHQDPDTTALPTLRVLGWDRHDTPRHMKTVSERLDRLRWPNERELTEAWKSRWASAFLDRPREAIRTSKEMATALADCAKQIRDAIQEILPQEKKGQPLTQLFDAVKATLNKGLDVPKFADTYAQTIAYGLLSKRIDQVQRWRAEKARTRDGTLPLPPITADALETAIPTNPFLSELLTSFMSAVGRDAGGSALDFDELGLGDLVDLLNTANMEAVLDDFDKDKQGDDPVIHFYEGFLAAYDKAMKVQRGVFYTPKPVVSFIVRSVDEVLRTEFGLPLGLADTATWNEFVTAHPDAKVPSGVKPDEPFVKILDPATGTGTFLVEVIDLIHQRMTEEAWKGKLAEEKRRLWNAYVPEHLLPRLYGYELMMAPYAVAHMKIGLKLADTGYDFSGAEIGPDGKSRPTRARVFLTNALEPAQDLDMQLAFMNEALAHEAKAANDAKARARFTVVVGNPPYAEASEKNNQTKDPSGERNFIGRLISEYFHVDGVHIKERNSKPISADETKFIRLGQHQIERSGSGVLGYISPHGFIDAPTLRGMRWNLGAAFSEIWCLDLHGNANRRETTPSGKSDENVFDIRQGVAITVAAKGTNARAIYKGDIWGSRREKYIALDGDLQSLDWRSVAAAERPWTSASELDRPDETWPQLKSIFMRSANGTKSHRDHFAICFSQEELVRNLEAFADPAIATSELRDRYGLPDTRDWNLADSRDAVRQGRPPRIDPYLYRPFDFRSAVRDRRLMDFPREGLLDQASETISLIATRQTKEHWDVLATNRPIDHKVMAAYDTNYSFPLTADAGGLQCGHSPNLVPAFTSRLANLIGLRFDGGSDAPSQGALPGTEQPPPPQGSITMRRERGDLKTTFGARDVFDWIYAVLHSPAYRERYADFLKSDFARVPLPNDRDLFTALIPLGTKLVALHLLDANALPDLMAEPNVRFVSNGGEARLGRVGVDKEVRRDAAGRVYLNAQNWFATVSQSTWEHWIGGYQPAQKWLKDRAETGSKDKLKPGHLLTEEDILHYRRMIVALEETGKVMAEIDQVIAHHGGWPDAFRGMLDG